MDKHFYYMRHGLSDCNIEFRLDHSTFGLNADGRKEVESKKEKIRGLNIQNVFSSPIPRAIETAEILFPDKNITIVDAISECTGEVWLDIENDRDTDNRKKYQEKVHSGLRKIEDKLTQGSLLIAHGGNFWAVSRYFGFDFKLLNTAQIVRVEKVKSSWMIGDVCG